MYVIKNLNLLMYMILQEEEEEEEVEEEEIQQPPRKQTGFKEEHETYKPVKIDTNIGKEADKQLLRDFINGDYCIHGVRYSLCYIVLSKLRMEHERCCTFHYLS